jgi:REP element-mobilizing transposase RayT
MATLDPIYAANQCNVAYQLDWSLTIFWRKAPIPEETWLPPLKVACEPDGIRLLRHQLEANNASLFLVSTRPNVRPVDIPQRVKGRLQHIVRNTVPKAFQRNYALRSIGSTRRPKLDEYLAMQLEHHPQHDVRLSERIAQYQIFDASVDLSMAQRTAHAMFWYNLHIVFVHEDHWRCLRDEQLQHVHDMILGAARKKQHRLSRAAIVPDHLHFMMGCHLEESPECVALSYLNNLAYAHQMQAIYRPSYFVGTFSEYDLGVIPRT